MLNLLWKKAGCGGIDKNNVHLLISELSLGELCAEHYNLRLMPPAWPGVSLNRVDAPTVKIAAETGRILDRKTLLE